MIIPAVIFILRAIRWISRPSFPELSVVPGSQDLAGKIGLPGHWSNHNQYTAAVRGRLTQFASQASRISDTQLALGVKNIQDWASKGLESGMFKIDPNTGRLL